MDLAAIVREQLRRRRAEGFAAFSGAAVSIRLPLREAVLTDLLRALLRPGGVVRDVSAAFGPGNRLKLTVSSISFGFVKRWNLDFDVARAVDFAQDPRLRLKLVSGGLLGFAPAKLVNALVAMPPGLTYTTGVLSIDLKALLENGAMGDLAPLVRTIGVTGESGVFIFDIWLRVE